MNNTRTLYARNAFAAAAVAFIGTVSALPVQAQAPARNAGHGGQVDRSPHRVPTRTDIGSGGIAAATPLPAVEAVPVLQRRTA
ncbi:hypothetical protein GN316_10695 [Xylophilus sp. Kf1]|nr:hypothetical protein [Xylophilus sp. Kf1]